MNLIDITITEILEKPKQVITNDICCWEVKVMTDCYGCKKEKIFRTTSKKEIEKYKKGFSWLE